MENNLSQIENKRMAGLNQARQMANIAEAAAKGPASLALSFWQKLSKHWFILLAALFFDLLGLIPFLGVVFNFLFGLILFLYFGPKKVWTGIVFPIGIASLADFFL